MIIYVFILHLSKLQQSCPSFSSTIAFVSQSRDHMGWINNTVSITQQRNNHLSSSQCNISSCSQICFKSWLNYVIYTTVLLCWTLK